MLLKELKDFCKLAGLVCQGNKPDILKVVKKYLKNYKYAPRYLRGLTDDEKIDKMFEIKYNTLKERKTGKKSYSPIRTDVLKSGKFSKYTEKWNRLYPDSKTLSSKSKISGVPLSILKKVYNKGMDAWRGGQHRPGATQHQWGVSRVNSFLLCGKTFYFPDHKLAQEAMERSEKAREFWKKQRCNFKKMGKRTPSR